MMCLQVAMQDLAQCSPAKLSQLRAELTDLRKFVVLNYIAVIKAAKKRNRHLQVIHIFKQPLVDIRLSVAAGSGVFS